MSEIRDPAQPASPAAPGDEGHEPSPGNEKSPEQVAAGAPPSAAAPPSLEGEDEGPQPGNEAVPVAAAPSDEYEESPEDSIGNRIDVAPSGQPPAALQPGGGKKRRRKGKGGGAQQAQDGPAGANATKDAAEQRRPFKVGDKVRAKIVSIGAAGAMVDLWGKERGVLDLREVVTPENPEARVGDVIPEVVVIQDGSRGGNVVVTRDPSRSERAREMIAQAFNNNEPIEGLITGVNRGGLEVDLSGVRAFCPSSQIDVRFPPTVNPKALVLTRQLFKITSLVEDGREAIVSRRAIVEQDVRARAEQAREQIKVGSVVKGVVTSIKDYGVFVDLGGIEGLIHISELTHNRSARPSDVVKVGEEIEAKVLRVTGGGPKEAAKEPAAAEAPVPEATAEAPVPEATAEAAPAEAAEAAAEAAAEEGAPAAEKSVEKAEKKGRKKERRREAPALPRVMLSRRAIEPDPWEGIEKRYPPGSVHTGKVARMQPFGAFIELEPGVDGLLHVSELGEGRRVEHPNEVLKDGQTLNVRVERVDRGARRISLTLLPEGVTEEDLKKAVNVRVGMVTRATVVEHDAHGFFAQIEGAVGKGSRGYISAADSGQPRGTDLRKAIPVGTVVTAKVVEAERGRTKLSIRAALQDEERQAYRAYQKVATSKSVGVSLADKLRGLMGGKSSS
jgi:small subunit ribosomal protein S1